MSQACRKIVACDKVVSCKSALREATWLERRTSNPDVAALRHTMTTGSKLELLLGILLFNSSVMLVK